MVGGYRPTEPPDPVSWIHLSMVAGIGVGGFWRLVCHFGSPARVLAAPKEALAQVAGIRANQLEALLTPAGIGDKALAEADRLAALGGAVVTFADPQYPEYLRQIHDPPPLLYTLGKTELLAGCTVAMVGSRSATAYGRRTSHILAKDLAGYGITVVSGMALGIDSCAHGGALLGRGSTIAVLGCGLDVVYPRQNRELCEQVSRRGLLVSEYPLGVQPEAFRFPARNRIIAGLSRGVIVVEATRKSGSLITAQYGLDEGRAVLAVPGQIDSWKSAGTHWLLRQGASLVTSADDVLDELGIHGMARPSGAKPQDDAARSALAPEALSLLSRIEPYAQTRDELMVRSGLAAGRLSELLLILELEGLIEMLAGDMIRRLSTGA